MYAAKVNQAAIPYHFGSRACVYLAVAEAICGALGSRLAAPLAALDAVLDTDPPATAIARALPRHMGTLFRALQEDTDTRARFAFILHEQQFPSHAFHMIEARLLGPVHGQLARAVGVLTARRADNQAVILTSHALSGLLVAFISGHASLQRRLGAQGALDADQIEAISATIENTAAALVRGLATPPPDA